MRVRAKKNKQNTLGFVTVEGFKSNREKSI